MVHGSINDDVQINLQFSIEEAEEEVARSTKPK
jgi:hypothetical protein